MHIRLFDTEIILSLRLFVVASVSVLRASLSDGVFYLCIVPSCGSSCPSPARRSWVLRGDKVCPSLGFARLSVMSFGSLECHVILLSPAKMAETLLRFSE